METTLDRFGRVVLPKKVRDEIGLQAGDALSVDAANGEVRLRPARGEPHLSRRGGVLVFTGQAAGDLEQAVRRERLTRLRKLSGRRPLRVLA